MQLDRNNKNIIEWAELVSKRTKISLFIISILISISAVFIRVEVDSQNRMVDIVSLSYDQEVILTDLNQRIVFLAKAYAEKRNLSFINRIQEDINNKIIDLNENHENLVEISKDRLSGLGFLFTHYNEVVFLDRIGEMINKITNGIGGFINNSPDAMVSTLDRRHGRYLNFLPDEHSFKLLYDYNNSVMNSSIRDSRYLSYMNIVLLLSVLLSIWLIWILFLSPISSKLKNILILYDESKKDIEYQVNYDELTGLYNRKYLSFIMDDISWYRVIPSIYFFIFDFDKFKIINDRYGHAAGDYLLNRLGRIVKKQQEDNEFQFRIGGDEFAIVFFTDKGVDYIKEKARLINEAAAESFLYEGATINSSISIGISHQETKKYDKKYLMRSADQSLYVVKDNGGDDFSIYSEINQSGSKDILTLEKELFLAVERKQFEVLYQPIVYLGDNKIVAAEALLRWNHESLGLISPSKWLVLAQRNNLLGQISSILIDQVKSHISLWRGQGVNPIRININLTENIFECEYLINELVNYQLTITDKNVFPIGVEITETVILDRNLNEIIEKIKLMKKNDITILLDDFGTGYATLSHLVKLPFDIIKIDKSFVTDIDDNVESVSIVEAILKLAQSLGKKVICEGVEDEAALKVLEYIGCEYVQGYYYSKPVSFDCISDLLKLDSSVIGKDYVKN